MKSDKIDFKDLIKEDEYLMLWDITNLCNLKCEYCFYTEEYSSKAHPDVGKYDPEYIAECFNGTGKTWLLYLNGGEPFLYPHFDELLKILCRNHYISLNTNLTTHNLFEFVNNIPVERIRMINASFHVTELEKRKNGIEKFIENFLLLQHAGFNIILSYITYPPFFSRIEKDLNELKSKGLKNVGVKPFIGPYNGKFYPEAYTNEEKTLIRKNSLIPIEIEVSENKVSFYGRYCSSGQTSFFMDCSGNIFRCASLKRRYGNLFSGKYSVDKFVKPCPIKMCGCPWAAVIGLKDKRAPNFLILIERIFEAFYTKRNLNRQNIYRS